MSVIDPEPTSGPRSRLARSRFNAGEDGSIIVGKILENDHYGFGFDAQKGEYVNLVTKGITDPTKLFGLSCRMQRQAPGF